MLAATLVAMSLFPSCANTQSGTPDTPNLTTWPAEQPTNAWQPTAILGLPTGALVVSDRAQTRLYFLEDPSKKPERLQNPSPSAVEWTALAGTPGLSFYALDGPGQKVHQYDLKGNYQGLAADLRDIAEEEALGRVEPYGLAVDGTGQILVSDGLGDRILVFDPSWDLVGLWGETGAELGAWRRPGRMVSYQTSTYVHDEGNNRVVCLGSLGEVLGSAEVHGALTALAAGAHGVFVATEGLRVTRLPIGRQKAKALRLPALGECDGENYVSALAVRGSSLFLSDGCHGRVIQLALNKD